MISQKISEDDEESDSHCDGQGHHEEDADKIRFEAIDSPSLRDIKRPLSIGSAKKLSLPPMKAGPGMLGQQRRGSQNSVRSIRSDEKSKKFLVEKLSERSGGVQRQSSSYRRDRLQGLELDYHVYLQSQQGIFVVRCQMMNIELQKIRDACDLEKLMLEFRNFKILQK